jgi:AcrR family transcriptional regulator
MHQAALDLFLEQGIDRVTVEEIAERADVAPSTFFRHFETKEDAVMVEVRERFDDLLAALEAQPAGPAWEMLTGSVVGWRETRRDPRLLLREVSLVAAHESLRARFASLLVAYEGRIAESLRARAAPAPTVLQSHLAAAWFLAAVRVVLRQWALDLSGTDPFELGLSVARALSHVPMDEVT